MSVSLAEERDRIRRQVEKLEQCLSVTNTDLQLLSSDTDNESESETSDEETTADILAQKEKIQKEIQNLESVLGPHSPSCVSDDDSNSSCSDDSELGLPLSVESCLQMNLVYQQVLQETLVKLETLLTNNQKQQKEVLCQMSGPVKEAPRERHKFPSSYESPANTYLGRFLKPYFKDKLTGLGPPANQETKEKTSRMTGFPENDKTKTKRWESWQKKLIFHAISRDTMMKLVQPKLSRVEFLSKKMASTKDETEKKQIGDQIENLEKEIERFKNMKNEELMGERCDEHDWQKISNVDFEGTKSAENIHLFWQNFLHPSINKSTWGEQEVQQLKEISSKHGARHWDVIAEELGMGRTAFMCLQTYQRFVSDSMKRSKWTSEEDNLLVELVKKMRIGNFIPYTQISYFMEGRDPGQLIYRWSHVLDPSIKRGHWTKEEDKLLLQAVARHGERNWWKIKLEVPGRTDSSCRDRYYDTLKAGIKRGAFNNQEKQLLQKLILKHGVGRWSKIASEIPHRIDAQCMREWRKMNKAAQENKSTKPTQRKKAESDTDEDFFTDESVDESSEEEEDYDEEDEDEEEEEEEEDNGSHQEEEVYVHNIPPMKEWIPVNTKEKSSELRYCRVKLPSSNDAKTKVRSTIAGEFGHSVVVGPSPIKLRGDEGVTGNSMMMVSLEQLQSYLHHKLTMVNKCGSKKTAAKVTFSNVGHYLQAAVLPWIGNLLIPESNEKKGSDQLRKLGEKTKVTSTSVFVLLLQVMRVDTRGCKATIEQRKYQVPSTLQTVAGILQQRTEKKVFEQQQVSMLNLLQKMKPEQTSQQQMVQTLQRFPVVLPPSNVFQMSSGRPGMLVSQPFIITNSVLKPPQNTVSIRQNIPTYVLNASPLPAARIPSHVPPPTQRLTSPGLTPSSISVSPQFVQINPGLQLVQPSALRPSVPLVSTSSQQTSSRKPCQISEVSNNRQNYQEIRNQTAPGTGTDNASTVVEGPSSTESPEKVRTLQETKQAQVVEPQLLNANNKNNHKVQKRGREEENDGGSNTQNNKNPSEALPTKRIRKPSQRVREMRETDHTRDEVKKKKAACSQKSSVNKETMKTVVLQSVTSSSTAPSRPSPSPSLVTPVGQVFCTNSQLGGSGLVFISNPPTITAAPLSVPQSAPLSAPMSAPLAAPLCAPLFAPVAAPLSAPQSAPLSAPLSAPQSAPMSAPLAAPLSAPQSAPLSAPVAAPLSAPRSTPLAARRLHPGQRLIAPRPPPATVNQPSPSPPPVPTTCSSSPLSQTKPLPNPGLPTPPPTPSKVPQPVKVAKPPPPTPPPPLTIKSIQFDTSLMFLESQDHVKDWLSGRGGVLATDVGVAMPFLPPFVSNLRTLTSLLKAKKSLTKSALQLLGGNQQPRTKTRIGSKTSTDQTHSTELQKTRNTSTTTTNSPSTTTTANSNATAAPSVSTDLQGEEEEEDDEEEKLLAQVSTLVTNRFSKNPAYQMLKARFLSCFTVPALLATIQPMTSEDEDEEEENDEARAQELALKKMKVQEVRRREKTLLACEESGNSARHFSGICNSK